LQSAGQTQPEPANALCAILINDSRVPRHAVEHGAGLTNRRRYRQRPVL